jgi:hypothetical protein
MRWAMSQSVKSSAKFVLVAMADCVNSEGEAMVCWPSVQHLSKATCQDRKTVMDNMQRLRDSGHIVPTGERKGQTGQVVVYLLKSPEVGTVALPQITPEMVPNAGAQDAANGTESHTVAQIQTVPDFPPNGTSSPPKESRIPHRKVPKAGHGTNKEQGRNKEGTRKRADDFDAMVVELPGWLEREDWQRWVSDRRARGKGITEDAARLQLRALDKYRSEGFTAVEVIDHSIASSYTGLYPPKRQSAPRQIASNKHSAAAAGFFPQDDQDTQEVIDV